MATPYHEGERAVQERAGVRALADRVGGSIRGAMPEVARRFIDAARLVVVGALDESGRPWASLVAGPGELARVIDERTIRVAWTGSPGDPLADVLQPGLEVGLLVPDLPNRRRMRVNGAVVAREADAIVVRSQQVYANCPQYIQPRTGEAVERLGAGRQIIGSAGLSPAHRDWLRRADTFFVTTAHPAAGVDTSHRGGPPGFLEVDGGTVRWSDFPGNAMFNTLGNIAAYPRAGLVVPDFSSGRALQLTGAAAIEWGGDGTTRQVSVIVEEVRERR